MAEQIGWEDYVRQIDAVTAAAQATDPGVVVLTNNYGEAGAGRYTDIPMSWWSAATTPSATSAARRPHPDGGRRGGPVASDGG